jgi:hypothetical protein
VGPSSGVSLRSGLAYNSGVDSEPACLLRSPIQARHPGSLIPPHHRPVASAAT